MSSMNERYLAYLRSATWRRKRAAALKRAGFRCQVCNGSKRLDVHHRTYARFGRERASDLIVLCRTCHDIFHKHRRLVRTGK